MPRIPILPGDVPAAANDPFGSLPPAQADGLRALQARDEGITRGLTVAEAWRDGVSALHRAEGAEDGAPAGFARDFLADADRGRSVALRSTLPGQREALDDDLQELRADLGDRAVTAEAAGLALRRRLGLRQMLETYAGGVAEDPGLFDSADGRIAKLVEGLGLPEARANAVRTEMRTHLANAAVDGLMANPAEAEAALRFGLYDDVLPKEIKQQRLTEAETKLQRARLLDGERRRQTLSRRAAEGAADETEIDAALADGGLSEYEADRLRLQTAQAQQDAETRRARIDRVAGGDPLDTANAEDRQAADAYWEEVSETLAVDDPAQQRQVELDLVRRLGVVPTGLAKTYRGMLLSRDPETVVNGARAIAEVERIVGSGAIPAEESRRAARIMEFADLGVAADRAIELAEAKVEEEGDRQLILTGLAGNDENRTPILNAVPFNESGLIAELPQLIPAILNSEGVEADDETVAALTTITETALALNLPLNNETAERLASLGELNIRSSTEIEPIPSAVGGYGPLLIELGKLLFRKIFRRKQRGDREPPLPQDRPLPPPPTDPSKDETPKDAPDAPEPGAEVDTRTREQRRKEHAQRRKEVPGETLPPGRGFKPDRDFLTKEEFDKLEDKGFVDPQRIRSSQEFFEEELRNEGAKPNQHVSKTVDEMAEEIENGEIDTERVRIRIVEWNGHVYAVDHRRLVAHRRAGADIPYKKVKIEEIKSKSTRARIRKAHTWNDNGSFIPDEPHTLKE